MEVIMSKKMETEKNSENLPVEYHVDVPIVDGKLQPTSLDGLWRVAVILSSSGMVPNAYKGKPNDVFVGLSWGLEIGLSHNQSLQAIAVIDGKPSIYGDVGLALVRGSGKLEDIHEFFEGEFGHDNYTAVCEIKRKGEKRVHRSEFTIEDAKLMGKWNKPTQKGYDSVWMKHPKRMLKWRARWFALRDVFGDVLKGLGIYEEVRDSIDMEQDDSGSYTVKEPVSTTVETPQPDKKPSNVEAAPETEEKLETEPAPEDYVNSGEEAEEVVSEQPVIDNRVTLEERFMQAMGEELEGAANDFVAKACDINGCPADEIYEDALGRVEEFRGLIENWAKRTKVTEAPRETVEVVEKVVEETPAEPEKTVTEQPEEAHADPLDIIHSKAALHYNGKLSGSTLELLDTYVEYIVALAGLNIEQILVGLTKTSDDWFNSFELWCDTEAEKVAEAKPDEKPAAPAKPEVDNTDDLYHAGTKIAETKPEVDNTGLIKPGKLSWPAWKLKWNTMRIKDYEGAVWSDLDRFTEAETEAQAIAKRARAKWSEFYPDKVYPVDARKAEAQEKQKAIEGGDDTAITNIETRWAFINKNYPKHTMAAMNKRNFANGGQTPGAKQMIIEDVFKACNPK